MKTRYPKTHWHRLLYAVLIEWLTPVGIDVKIDVSVSANPPEIDLVLLKTLTGKISRQQRERLADGLRDSKASILILEFKYTESLNLDAILQTLAYETFYRRIQKILKENVEAFLLSSKTPKSETLKSLGYQQTENPGVYRSGYPGINRVTLLILNELADTPNNIPLKCFASQKNEMRKAHEFIYKNHLPGMSRELGWILDGLWQLLLNKHPTMEDPMKQVEELTPEYVRKVGKEWVDHLKTVLPAEEWLDGLDPQTRLKGLKSEHLLQRLTTQERLQGLEPEERLQGLNPEERLQGLGPEERLQGLEPEERLQGLSPEQLKKLKEKLNDL